MTKELTRFTGSWVLAFCLLSLMSPVISAQEETIPPASKGGSARTSEGTGGDVSSSSVLVSPEEDYRIGPGDVIEIKIEDAPELSGNFRVTAGGTFLMHYLGRIKAAKRTPEELAKFIADGLRERYLYDPRVNVIVKQYNSRSFFIQGAVRNAGVFQIEGRTTLLELLTLAGGLGQNHGSSAFIIRKIKKTAEGDPVLKSVEQKDAKAPADTENKDEIPGESDSPPANYTMMKVNLTGLLRGKFDENMYLEPGDIVNVPLTDVFFVAGEVKAPGSFPLKDGTTLRQAISLAQGTNFKAAPGRGMIFREDPNNGKRIEIPVDIGAVMSGKTDDVEIFANDVIIVPNSKAKSIAAPILNAFGLSLATRMVIF